MRRAQRRERDRSRDEAYTLAIFIRAYLSASAILAANGKPSGFRRRTADNAVIIISAD